MPRSRGRSGRPWHRLAAWVYATFDACWICERPVDFDAPPRSPWSKSVDHVIGISEDESLALDPDNVRLAHYGCNTSRQRWKERGIEIAPLDVERRSRDWFGDGGGPGFKGAEQPGDHGPGDFSPRKTRQDRFLGKVDKAPNGCWLWTGSLSEKGYAQFWPGPGSTGRRSPAKANRWAYENFVGPIPTGASLRNACGERRCVNPEHWKVRAAT